MDTVIYIIGAIVFFALIMLSVSLHEFGHMVPAKIFGVKVTEYFVGFGKTLWSFRRGETEYGLKALPLGGYVKLVGMYPPKNGKVRGNTNPVMTLIEDSRAAEWEDIKPEDDGRLMYQQKSWKKLIVMLAGPATNLILAFVILWGVFGIHGIYQPQLTVASVSQCVVTADRTDQTCQPGDPIAPAAQMGMLPGDRIVAFNGEPVRDWEHLQEIIRGNLDRSARITVERDGRQVDLTPGNTMITGVQDKLDPSKTIEAGFLGVSPTTEKVHLGPAGTLNQMWTMTSQSVIALGQFPVRVWNTAVDLVTGQPRDVNGPMSIVGASRVAGEVSSTDQMTGADKVATFFTLLGNVNLFVGLFNLVPLLPLDGGHILGVIVEWIRRQGARIFRRPDPGFIDTAKMLPVAYAVFAFIAISGVVLVAADIFSPVTLF
ncbi:M50 family metallopeptidase [Granulicoccus phenolivorans]|uniref:M50 family metallopeptidase n=1 Tax=Granulicoccus phenolivorans TaxID=266854 RepID=UPI0003FC955D|nr:site-2 protease family protein [Granulicoccus phenolivorans]